MVDDEFIYTVGVGPRPFALCWDSEGDESAGGEQVVVGWGMVLPNGSTVVVGCDGGGTVAMSITSSPERAAWLHAADLVWTQPERS